MVVGEQRKEDKAISDNDGCHEERKQNRLEVIQVGLGGEAAAQEW